MARYISDQNKVALLHESGTYAVTSGNGIWPGQVTDHTVTDEEGIIVSRYLGTASRSYSDTDQGPRDVTGTLNYNPQDMRFIFWAIGSTYDESGANSFHTATQINTDSILSPFTSGTQNPPVSFTIEDSKQAPGTGKNFIRTVRGCVLNSTELSCSQGEKWQVNVDYIGQNLEFSSGTTTSITEETNRPYLWNDSTLTVGGSNIDHAKSISLTINNNMSQPHYLNGSRDIATPYPGNFDLTLSITLDLDSDEGKQLYNNLYKGGSSFNAVLDLDASRTGSQHAIFTMSGCNIVNTPDLPSPNEDVNEATIEVMPQTITAQSWDSTDATLKYNPW